MKKIVGILAVVLSVFMLVACGAGSITKKVEVTFSGYDGIGNLEYNDDVVEAEIKEILLKNVGFSADDIKTILAEDSLAYSFVVSSGENIAKYKKFEEQFDSIDYGFDKQEELSNGDEVTFEITSDNKKLPIKLEKRKFKVEGLKKSQKLSAEEVLKDQYSFTGYNGFGKVTFAEKGRFYVPDDQNNSLSNGEEVEIKILEQYKLELAKEGKILEGDSVSIKVSNLKELSDIKGIQDVLAKIPELASSSNKDQDYPSWADKKTYALEKQRDFLYYSNGEESYYSTEPMLTVVSVYKVTETITYGKYYSSKPEGTVETKEYYSVYGYKNIEIIDNQLILSDLTSTGSGWTTYDNIESAVLTLEKDGYKEYVSE
ncbi:TPA: hypothetical protein U1C40_000976 [Streptococcus suis]|nr:hypothetical protein [Streptococcus suis]